MKDSFGVTIDPGDYVLSAAPSSGWAKIGTVYAAPSGRLMLEIAHSSWDGHQKRSEIGSTCAVLRKADGTVPAHIGYTSRLVVDGKPRKIVESELGERREYTDVYDVWVEKEDA